MALGSNPSSAMSQKCPPHPSAPGAQVFKLSEPHFPPYQRAGKEREEEGGKKGGKGGDLSELRLPTDTQNTREYPVGTGRTVHCEGSAGVKGGCTAGS